MELLTLFCVITVAFTGLTSGAGVLPEDSVNASVGGSVTFTTSLTPTQTPLNVISWNFGVKNIITYNGDSFPDPEYEDRITLNVFTGSLELRIVSVRDSGDYSANIIPAGGAPTNGFTTLNVYEKVSNVRITANDTDLVEFIDTVRLSCSASGSSLSFLWFNDSVEVTASDRVRITDGGATLTIVTVLRYDQGSYTCNVSNPVSSSTSDEEPFIVSYGPEGVNLTTSPSAEYYAEGSVVSFSCSADSRPVAQFRWFINGEMLSSTGAQINLVMEQSGNYSCQAFNSKTLRYTSSQSEEILLLKNITNGTVKSSNPPVEGGSVNLTCNASGPIPTFYWMFNGVELKTSENTQFYEEKRVLSFRNLSRKDSGRYTCRISNPVSSQSVDYTMNVNYGPDSVQISGPTDIQERSTLKLNCSAESVPTAKYTWTKDGTTLGQSHEYTKDNIEFSDSGEYICRATNDITLKSLEASHKVNVTVSLEQHNDNGLSTGGIVGIVFGCIAVILLISGGVFCALQKKNQKPKSNTRTDGEGRDNSAFAQNQEVNYADVRFVKKGGAVVQLGAQNGSQDNTEYSEVRKNNNPPVSRLPTYDAHMQQGRRAAPEPPTEYARVRPR